MKKIFNIVIALGIAFIVWFGFFYTKKIATPSVSSFKDCVQAGYLVTESYPRQCKTENGRIYIEEIVSTITYTNSSVDLITVESPLPGDTIHKDLSVIGKARGTWFFEASFPIQVLDKDGKVLSQGIAEAQSDWMTSDFVPFKATINIPDSYTGPVTLVLKKDNPSDLPEHDASISFPLIKEASPQNTITIKLYYYNPAHDQGPGGAQCSRNGLVPVERIIPRTITPIQDSIKLLLRGEIENSERTQGITSEFPLQGVTLKAASLVNGQLTLTFADPQNKTGGGSCHVSILWSQIEATAKQFPEVKSVRFMPEELFQP